MQGAHTNMKPKRSACQIRGLTVSVCCLVRVENVQQEFKRFLLKTAVSCDRKWFSHSGDLGHHANLQCCIRAICRKN